MSIDTPIIVAIGIVIGYVVVYLYVTKGKKTRAH